MHKFGAEPNQRSVGAAHANRIGNQVVFGPIFARDGAIMRPVPIQNQLTLFSLSNQVPVRLERGSSRQIEGDPVRSQRNPTGARQAVLGRVNGVAGTLAGEISYEKTNRRRRGTILILARQKIAGP